MKKPFESITHLHANHRIIKQWGGGGCLHRWVTILYLQHASYLSERLLLGQHGMIDGYLIILQDIDPSPGKPMNEGPEGVPTTGGLLTGEDGVVGREVERGRGQNGDNFSPHFPVLLHEVSPHIKTG